LHLFTFSSLVIAQLDEPQKPLCVGYNNDGKFATHFGDSTT
jgi:hypothetical protein